MQIRLPSTNLVALDSAAMARAGGMFMITMIMTATRMRGAIG